MTPATTSTATASSATSSTARSPASWRCTRSIGNPTQVNVGVVAFATNARGRRHEPGAPEQRRHQPGLHHPAAGRRATCSNGADVVEVLRSIDSDFTSPRAAQIKKFTLVPQSTLRQRHALPAGADRHQQRARALPGRQEHRLLPVRRRVERRASAASSGTSVREPARDRRRDLHHHQHDRGRHRAPTRSISSFIAAADRRHLHARSRTRASSRRILPLLVPAGPRSRRRSTATGAARRARQRHARRSPAAI